MPFRAPTSRHAAVLSVALLLTASGLTVALADGGKGGGTGGGVGGAGYNGAAGGDGATTGQYLHGGGAGGGAGGGLGGAGGPGSGVPGNEGPGGQGGDGGLNNQNGASAGDGTAGTPGGVGTVMLGGGSGGGGGAGGAGFYFTTSVGDLLGAGGATIIGGKGGAAGKGWANGGAGGGGGDGGGGAVMANGFSITVNTTSVTGGVGGRGGDGATAGNPGISGRGGNGGDGVAAVGGNVTVQSGAVRGGNGGAGGNGGNAGQSTGGNGGTGGDGISATGPRSVSVMAGTTVTGGNGGAAGIPGVNNSGTPLTGAGGAGIVASNGIVVKVAGTVSGGMDGTNTTRAHAIDFTGGGNTLVLASGFAFNGNAVGDGTGDTLGLGGDDDDSFDLSLIGTTFQNFDTFTKGGLSSWTLTGTSSFGGDTAVSGGALVVNGSLANSVLSVQSGGTLGGMGTVGATTVQSGGTIAPGNSIGTLHTGALTLSVGSSYVVEVAPDGTSDNIAVTGGATLAGTVVVTSASGVNDFPSTPSQYTILTATGGVTGRFNGLDTSALAFFDGSLDYATPNAVTLTLARNQASLTDLAQGGNQMSTAGAIESLGTGNPLYSGILGLGSDQVQSAYQQLSGESLGSADQGQVQSAGLVSTAVVDRVNQAFDALKGAGASNYLPTPDPVTQAFDAIDGTPDPTHWMWISGYGARASVDASAQNAASATDTGGLTFGLDGELNNWTVGAMGGYGHSANTVAALDTSIGSADYSAGVYAGTEWDSIRLALGAVYTQSAVASTRNITLPSVQTLTADYAASTGSLFGEAAKEFDFGVISLTPYAGAQYVRSMGDAYSEQGGTAALSVAARTNDIFYTTVGLRTSADFVVGGDMLLSLGAGAGWKHAFADQSTISHSFVAGGNSFAVSSAEVPADRLAVEASAGLDVSSALALDLSYTGEFTSNAQTSQIQAGAKGSF